jgi:hypothetical protein
MMMLNFAEYLMLLKRHRLKITIIDRLFQPGLSLSQSFKSAHNKNRSMFLLRRHKFPKFNLSGEV